ncbi:MAG: hypothetical protein IJ111_02080 [Eggerthellaceae bacterium]|nr:hypothetical protein [Eggerthellaceae bacterium]
MVTDYIRARDELHRRLARIFEPELFATLYPQAEKSPKVFLGFPVTEPPYYCAVDEIIDNLDTAGSATMGHAEVSFTLHVWLSAQHADLEKASNTLLCYIDAVAGAVLADQRLNMSVDNSFAGIEASGTAADSSKRYIAAASMAVECTVYSQCPAALLQAVADANEG